jgi:hypothetical protein
MTTLKRAFSFSDWEKNVPQAYRSKIERIVGIAGVRYSLLFSTSLSKDGMTYYFVTNDRQIANDVLQQMDMSLTTENINYDELGIEFGNSGLLKS